MGEVEDIVQLRPVAIGDGPRLLEWENQFLHLNGGIRSEPYSMEEILAYVAEAKPECQSQRQIRSMISTADGKTVGTVDLYDISGEEAKLGILIADILERGKGYGRTAVIRMLEKGYADYGIRRVVAVTDSDNECACRLFESCGFVKVEEDNMGGSRYVFDIC